MLAHVEHNLAVDGAERLDAGHLADLVRLELDGELTATQAKTVLAEMVAERRVTRRPSPRTSGSRPWTPRPSRRSSTRSIADSPTEWGEYVEGDEKRRGKITGFFVGKVMKATKGQADGRAVNAILAARRSSAG